MDWMLQRVFDGGRVLPVYVRVAGSFRGTLSVTQEHDPVRRRVTMVARFHLRHDQASMKKVPPLYDVQLVESNGARWIMSGVERIEGGTLRDEYVLGQSWILQPAADEDYARAVAKVNELSERLSDLNVTTDPRQRNGGTASRDSSDLSVSAASPQSNSETEP